MTVLISPTVVNVVNSNAGRSPAAAGGAIEENNLKNSKIDFWLDCVVELSLGVLFFWLCYKTRKEKTR